MQVNTRHQSDQQLRDILHTIATHREIEPCVSLILQAALQINGALGAAFRSADETPLTLAIGERSDLDFDAAATCSFATIDPVSGALVCPVRDEERLHGILWITLERRYRLSGKERDLLAALVDGLLIVMTRAHARRVSEQAEQLSRSLLDSIADPLLVFDQNWTLMLLNPAAGAVFSLDTKAAFGKKLDDVVRSDDLIAFVGGRQALNEWNQGDQIFVPHVQPVYDEDEQWIGSILALRDITRYKKLNQSQHEFVRIVSHDVRSPLTSIRGFADMLGTVGDLNEKQNLFVDKILNGVLQITTLVDNIQDAGRFDVETGFYEMSRSNCDLREMVNRIVNNHLVPAEKQELKIAYSIADEVPILNADANMLERGITNLVDNAIKYTPNGGKIDVLVTLRDKNVIISVRDNGFGISPENQKRLFQRHVRIARQEHKRIKGTGLGLFIVKSVAQRHGGDAWVESSENTGSTFSFNIPLKGANLVAPARHAG